MRRTDGIIAIAALALTAIYALGTSRIHAAQVGDPLGPKFYPYLLCGGLVISALMILMEGRRGRGAQKARAEPRQPIDSRTKIKLLGAGLWTALFYLAFEPLGFILSSFVYMLGMVSVFHPHRHLMNLTVSVAFSVGAYGLFHTLLGVPLPRGLLSF